MKDLIGCAGWARRKFEGAPVRGSPRPYLPSSPRELAGCGQTSRRGREDEGAARWPPPILPSSSPLPGQSRGRGGRRGPGRRSRAAVGARGPWVAPKARLPRPAAAGPRPRRARPTRLPRCRGNAGSLQARAGAPAGALGSGGGSGSSGSS